MTHYLQDNDFPSRVDRRRAIQKILPISNEKPVTAGELWAKTISWIAITVMLITAQYCPEFFKDTWKVDMARPGSYGAPLYHWSGYHRVAF